MDKNFRLCLQRLKDGKIVESTSYDGHVLIGTVMTIDESGKLKCITQLMGNTFKVVPIKTLCKTFVEIFQSLYADKPSPNQIDDFIDQMLVEIDNMIKQIIEANEKSFEAELDKYDLPDEDKRKFLDQIKKSHDPNLSNEESINIANEAFQKLFKSSFKKFI